MRLKNMRKVTEHMIATILKYAQGSGQSITEWIRYVNVIDLRTSIYKTRFMIGPFCYSPFVNLIKQILHDVEWSNLLKCKSDYSRYQQIYYLTGTFRAMIDPVYLTREFGRIFTSGGTPDYTLNVTSASPMRSMPLDKPWKDWENYHPVHIVHHDALELVTDLNKFSVEFKGKQPTRLVASMDIVMLIFKYLKYMEMCRETDDDDSIEAYLQRHIVPSWFADLRRIWLFNVLNEMMFSDRFDPMQCTSDPVISPVSSLNSVLPDITRIQSEIRNLQYGEILATDWFGMRWSLRDWMLMMRDNLQVPELRQYTYLKFLEEIPYASFVIKLNNMIRSRKSENLNKELYQLLKRYHDSNIYAGITHSTLKESVRYEVSQLLALAK